MGIHIVKQNPVKKTRARTRKPATGKAKKVVKKTPNQWVIEHFYVLGPKIFFRWYHNAGGFVANRKMAMKFNYNNGLKQMKILHKELSQKDFNKKSTLEGLRLIPA